MKRYMRFSSLLRAACLCCLLTLLIAAAAPAAASQYGQVNYDQVRLRKQMESTDVWAMLNTGNVVEILKTHKYNGITYYYVTCHNPSHPERQYWGYIDARYVTLVSEGQAMSAASATATPAPAATAAPAATTATVETAAATANTGSAVGSIQFTARGVNLRKQPSTNAKVLGQFAKSQITAYFGTVYSEGHTWYQVSNGEYSGYVMGDYVQVLSGTGAANAASDTAAATAAPAAAVSPAATAIPASAAAQSGGIALTTMEKVIVRASGNAKGTQIKLLNRASQVCTLLGPTNVADGYTWYNVHVKDIDGWIRGDLLRILSATEAAAYTGMGTVSASADSSATASASGATLYTPELADWNTSDIQKIFYKGCVATVTDVKTGISFQVKRWSGGSHADVEPLTASDTAAICRIYGVSTAQEIADKNMYQRRSILVTVSGHSYAASMYGVPHNASEGDTISDNNYSGQFCIHFTNSSTHGTKNVDADHQSAVNYAYNNAVDLLTRMGYNFQ